MRWSTTILPVKIAADQREIHWSEWLESLRKDVEDTFGILKGCWHILKTGIHLHGVEVAGNIWKTCCALHNMLLEINGLDVEWSGGIGIHDEGDVENYLHPFALDCLQRNFTSDVQNYDASNMGPGDDIDYETVDDEPNEEGAQDDCYKWSPETVQYVQHMTMQYFRKKLVAHFDILWSQHRQVWPCRTVNH